MPERSVLFAAAPISALRWSSDDLGGVGHLKALDEPPVPYEVLNLAGHPCDLDGAGGFLWAGRRPLQVEIRWIDDTTQRRAPVPVIDELGRFAASALPALDIEEAWWQLAHFPMPPEDEDLPADDETTHQSGNPLSAAVSCGDASLYPVRQMMQLIENIAVKQTKVAQADWTAWCTRLTQCLMQASASPVIAAFQALGINPLSPLRHAAFRPAYAEDATSPDGEQYESVLDRIEEAWQVKALRALGDSQ